MNGKLLDYPGRVGSKNRGIVALQTDEIKNRGRAAREEKKSGR
jgi:hypothetical protein